MKEMAQAEYKELFLCDGCHGGHAVGISVYPGLGMDEVYIEWWTSSGGEWDNLWERIKAAWTILRKGRYCTHDVILHPQTADKVADALIEAANLGRQAEVIGAKVDAEFQAKLAEYKKEQSNES